MAELFCEIKRSVAELFRQIKRSVAELFRQIKRNVAEHLDLIRHGVPIEKNIWFIIGGLLYTLPFILILTSPPCTVSAATTSDSEVNL